MNAIKTYIQQLLIIYFIINISSIAVYSQRTLDVGFVSVTTDFKNIKVIVLRTDEIKASQYIFYRADGDSNNYKEIAKTTDNFFTDKNVDPNKQTYCYRVSYIGDDGVQSEISAPFCSIFLSSNEPNTINWTPFLKLPNAEPVEYYIDIINNDGSINRVNSYRTTMLSANIKDVNGVKKEMDDFDQAVIRVRAVQRTTFNLNSQRFINYPIEIYSNSFTIIPPPNIFVPNAFTPDGNGINEIFEAKGKRIVEFKMTIFNKWGDIVFESFDMNSGWDGTQFDRITPSPSGNYAYKITAKDKFNQPFEKIGTIFLIR
ncbi:gliding motility-associated C-terminal domain-containing protein [Emticicia sp. SJ17W-69]|uniref:T9SS type B sorting domain-containing protein n=1 Tax=Emticicia sp. SJ17W-69 TaxID=3421657 RepID=UPI003EC08E5C